MNDSKSYKVNFSFPGNVKEFMDQLPEVAEKLGYRSTSALVSDVIVSWIMAYNKEFSDHEPFVRPGYGPRWNIRFE